MKNITLTDSQFAFLKTIVKPGGYYSTDLRDVANEVYSQFFPTPVKLSFADVTRLAQRAGDKAVDTFLVTHDEPMYCGVAYLYRKIQLPLKSRQRKIRYEEDRIPTTGFAATTQSLDLQEMWCKAASAVFAEHGFDVLERSWVD